MDYNEGKLLEAIIGRLDYIAQLQEKQLKLLEEDIKEEGNEPSVREREHDEPRVRR